MAHIELVDVSIRDGNQSLWGATGLRTPQILQIAPVMDRVGFRALDYTSSTHMGIAVRTHRENPWERIRLTRQAMPNTALQFIGTGFRFISWETSHPDVMQLVYDRLAVNGIDRVVVLDPMHDTGAAVETARMLKKAGIREVVGALVYTVSEVHDDAFYAGIAEQMASCPDIDRLYVKDPSGLLTPERAGSLLPTVRGRLDGKPLEMHSHCTLGLSPLTYVTTAGLVDTLQVACGPLANGSSLPDAERVVANLRELGHTVDVDERLLRQVADYFHRLATVEGLPPGTPQQFDAAFLRHQVAGGVMSTTRRQLRELGMEDRFDAVLEEVPRVRAELGSPIMVTPFPQMVCSQALFNVIGPERYHSVPDQVIRYFLGRFGRPPGPVDPEVRDRILDRPRARELANEPPPTSPDELRRELPRGVDDEELLLRATMPADQVDAMLAAGPAPRHYTPEAQPVLRLVDELRERPQVGELTVRKGDLTITARSRRTAGANLHSHDTVTDDALGRLRRARGFVFDMDGTLVLGDRRNQGLQPLPGAVELTTWLHERSVPYVVVTNGTTRPPADYARAMRALGFPLDDDALLTPVSAAVEVFAQRGHRVVMVLGGDGLTEPLTAAGFDVVAPVDGAGADAVLAGWYRDVTFDDLEAACDAVWAGAAFYSCSQSRFFATSDGRTLGTSRAISAVVHDLTGVQVEVVGKPSVHILTAAAHRLGVAPEEIAVVGDDPELEMAMAHRAGALAVSVSTGVQEHAAFADLPPDQTPDLRLSGVSELAALVRAPAGASGGHPDGAV